MFIKLSKDFSDLSSIEIRSHSMVIERILIEHGQARHIFCLTPRQITAIRASVVLGPFASAVLDVIGKRYQDYIAASLLSEYWLVILPIGATIKPPLGKEYYVEPENIGWWLTSPPALYVENGINDGNLYKYLISFGVSLLGATPSFLSIRPFHGGGSPLGAVISELVGDSALGICICDRDSHGPVPPFTTGTTGQLAHQSLCDLGILPDRNALHSGHPFFYLVITEGWGLENCIGPHALEAFFEANPETAQTRATFQTAFPSFPNLTSEELNLWSKINFKESKQVASELELSFRQEYPGTIIPSAAFVNYAKLVMPGTALSFIALSQRGRHRSEVLDAIKKDMQNERFESEILNLARLSLTALSADSTVTLS